MSTLKEYRDAYYDRSQRASDNARQLAFAGVAFVWVFKAENAGLESVPHALYVPALMFAATLLLDFFHYLVAAAISGAYTWWKERRGFKPEDTFSAPRWLNWPGIGLFWAKQSTLCCGYLALGSYLYQRVAPAVG